MFGEENRENRTAYILFLAAAALAAALILWAGNLRFEARAESMVDGPAPMNFSEGWTLVQDGAEVGVISMPHKSDTAPGTPVTMSKKLPENTLNDYAICFHTAYSSVEVRVGDRLLYRYNSDGARPFGKATPSRWNMVQIPADCAGQTISVTLHSPYRASSGVLSPVWLGAPLKLSSYLLHQYIPQILVCGVFLILGVAIFISSFYLRNLLQDICTVRCLGIFVALAALWMINEVEFPAFIWEFGFAMATARDVLTMICPLPYLLYLMHRFPREYQPAFRRLCYLFFANFFISMILQMTNVADFMETAWMTHVCLGIMFLVLLAVILQRIRKERSLSAYFKLECAGIGFLALSLGAEMVLHYRMEYMRSGDYLRSGLFGYIICLFAALLMDTRKKREEAARMGRELQDSRLRLMISQIQPHFIYNTLSSIRTLIKLDPDRAYSLVYDFSKYLRANIDSIGQGGMIPFARELEHIQNYCNIEKVRFGDKLSLVYDIGPDGFEVPPLTVQPLVENAIKHGIRGKNGGGTVKVRTAEDENSYLVEVLDDGAGFDTGAEVSRSSAGLENIRLRLREIAGAGLEINSIPGKGTRAIVRIPKHALT